MEFKEQIRISRNIGKIVRYTYVGTQVAFIILRILGITDWPWYVVAMPSLVFLSILFTLYAIIGFLQIIIDST